MITDRGTIGFSPWWLTVFQGSIYAGGTSVTKDVDGTWSSIGSPGGSGNVVALLSFNDELYAANTNLKRIYKYVSGTTWTQVGTVTFSGSPSIMIEFESTIYVGCTDGKVYKLDSGDWVQVGTITSVQVQSFAILGGSLYATGYSTSSGYREKVYRLEAGPTWTPVSDTLTARRLITFNGELYGVSSYGGGHLYKYAADNDWTWLGDLPAQTTTELVDFSGHLVLVMLDYTDPVYSLDLWSYDSPENFTLIGSQSLADAYNPTNAVIFNEELWFGANNIGEVYSCSSGVETVSVVIVSDVSIEEYSDELEIDILSEVLSEDADEWLEIIILSAVLLEEYSDELFFSVVSMVSEEHVQNYYEELSLTIVALIFEQHWHHYYEELGLLLRAIVKSKLIDAMAPSVKGRDPKPSETAVPINKKIGFYLTGTSGDGVDIDQVSAKVNNVTYTKADPEFHYSGTPDQYYIEVGHPDFNYEQAVEVEIEAKSLCGASL